MYGFLDDVFVATMIVTKTGVLPVQTMRNICIDIGIPTITGTTVKTYRYSYNTIAISDTGEFDTFSMVDWSYNADF